MSWGSHLNPVLSPAESTALSESATVEAQVIVMSAKGSGIDDISDYLNMSEIKAENILLNFQQQRLS